MQGALLYMPSTIGPKQRHSPLLTTTLNRADARRLCPRRLAESDVAHYCFESGCGAALG